MMTFGDCDHKYVVAGHIWWRIEAGVFRFLLAEVDKLSDFIAALRPGINVHGLAVENLVSALFIHFTNEAFGVVSLVYALPARDQAQAHCRVSSSVRYHQEVFIKYISMQKNPGIEKFPSMNRVVGLGDWFGYVLSSIPHRDAMYEAP